MQMPNEEEVYNNHLKDLALREKFGVEFLTYLYDKEGRLIFCIMVAASKDNYVSLHEYAHGDIPCQIIELKPDDQKRLLGENFQVNLYDMLINDEGIVDTGLRYILCVDILHMQSETSSNDYFRLLQPDVDGSFKCSNGNTEVYLFRTAAQLIHDLAAFTGKYATLQHQEYEFRFAITTGSPVTKNSDTFFGEDIDKCIMLCNFAPANTIIFSDATMHLLQKQSADLASLHPAAVQLVSHTDVPAMVQLHHIISSRGILENKNLESIYKALSLSKSTAYRKIKQFTGRSPVELILECKLRSAYHLVHNAQHSLSQIAYASGFSSLSYFSRLFKKRFGYAPSSVS